MNDETKNLEESIDELKRQYRSIKAPPYLAAKVRAAVSERKAASHHWWPALAAIAMGIAVFGIVPFLQHEEATSKVSPSLPSLTALARLAPTKPKNVSPSLTQIRSVSTPPMPSKPKHGKRPQSNSESNDIQLFKENNYEYG